MDYILVVNYDFAITYAVINFRDISHDKLIILEKIIKKRE